ncbi:MAG: hypothetical protein IJC43_08305 [Clostridia bacterium]|nr:hypothetical protein [Clostridia bacterium]
MSGLALRFGLLRVSPWLVLLIALFFTLDRSIYAPLLLLSAMLHEMGHLRALWHCGVPVTGVTLHPFGIEIEAPGLALLPYRDELCVAAAGPLCNLLTALCTLLTAALFGSFPGALFFTVCNLTLCLLNLMPVTGLDGGRMLAALVLPVLGLERGEAVLQTVSGAASALILTAGLVLLWVTRCNFSLAMVGAYLLARQALKGDAP